MERIVFTGGGTAGHVIPALALLPELKKRGIKATFIGGNGMEKELAEAENLPFFSTSVVKLDRANPLNNLKIPFVLLKGVAEAEELLRFINPDVVFSKGGYASLPTCFAAKKLNVPVIVHESDYSFGVANRLVKKFAALTITSFPETQGGICIGNPVRQEIFHGSPYRARAVFPIDPSKKTVLVFGGSTGAEKINLTVYKALDKLTACYNVIHIAGKSGDFTIKHSGYHQIRYCRDIADLYALANVAVSRGGANSLAELAAINKPAVIIPLPKGTSRGDQLDNAKSYYKRGYFEILPQDELYAETLLHSIKVAEKKKSPKSPPCDVNTKIVEKIIETVENLQKCRNK